MLIPQPCTQRAHRHSFWSLLLLRLLALPALSALSDLQFLQLSQLFQLSQFCHFFHSSDTLSSPSSSNFEIENWKSWESTYEKSERTNRVGRAGKGGRGREIGDPRELRELEEPEGEPPFPSSLPPPRNVTKLFILDFNCQPLGRVPICFTSVAPKKSILARKLGKQGLGSTPATIGEYKSVGGCLCALWARGWRMCIF